MKKYLLIAVILTLASCTDRRSSNNNESSQSPADSAYNNNNAGSNNGNGTSMYEANPRTIVAADFMDLFTEQVISSPDTRKHKVRRHRSADFGNGIQNLHSSREITDEY